MKYFILSSLLVSVVLADTVNTKTLACPNMEILKKAPVDKENDAMDLSFYAIANGCEILSKKDNIEVIGYDPRNSKEMFQKIIYKKTGVELYVKSSAITVEQGGKKNSIRF